MEKLNLYKQHAVTTQTPGNLVVMLYEGAVKFLKMAIDGLDRKDYAAFGTYIGKAVAIIDELQASLDVDAGGQVAENLWSLYVFMRRDLDKAHVKKDREMIRDIINILEDLNKGWKGIAG